MFEHRSSTRVLLAAACAAVSAAGAARAQCPGDKLLATDRQTGDWLGTAVSVYANIGDGAPHVMSGAPMDDTAAGSNAGSVYVFRRSGGVWQQASQFFANDAQADDRFGQAVSCDDPYAIIGATGVGATGAAYIYERIGSPFLFAAKFIPAGSTAGDDVGRSVAITADNGGWALIGAPMRDVDLSPNFGDSDPDAGVVYLVRRTSPFTWTVIDTWPTRFSVNAGLASGEQFGSAVAIRGNVAVCGAPFGQNINWPDSHGYVQVYRRQANNSWLSQGRLVSNNAASGDRYGAAVATDGVSIAIGAPDDDATAAQLPMLGAKVNSGCVYIQRWHDGDWYLDGQVFAPDASDNANFGSSVSIDGDTLVVGAAGAKKAYVFKRLASHNWVPVHSVADPDNTAWGSFASAVGVRAGHMAIGDAHDDHDASINQGAVYAFNLATDLTGSDSCTAPTIIPGHGTYTGCTLNATPSQFSPVTTCGNTSIPQGPDVWFSWTPLCTGNIIIDTVGSNFDTVLSVHSACPTTGQANTIVCNDDATGLGLQSLVTFNYVRGQTYLIRVTGYAGAAGQFALRVVDWAVPANDRCQTAQSIGNGTFTFSNCRADTQTLLGPSCTTTNGGLNPVHDVWYRYTADCQGTVHINTCGSSFDTVVQVFDGSICPVFNNAAIACNDDSGPYCGPAAGLSRLAFAVAPGQQFYIRVGAYDFDPSVWTDYEHGDGVLNVSCTAECRCDWNANGSTDVPDIFAFLVDWFAGSHTADFNLDDSVGVSDIFAFLACWFAGCP
ncbi:MAG: hypothetical protein KF869_10860 [Phycisphaeraceae bacterium]|nr:hypothetical protein [Phycisphaeraceae bacterium]